MKQIVVISGKGGTGKTVISGALAALVKNKVMVDCDVDAANLYLLLHPEIKEEATYLGGKKALVEPDLLYWLRKLSNLLPVLSHYPVR